MVEHQLYLLYYRQGVSEKGAIRCAERRVCDSTVTVMSRDLKHLAQAEETFLLPGQLGLFATEDIKAGTFVASFGRVRQVKCPFYQPYL